MTSRPPRRRDDGPVGLVLAGGGARGAYEAGVLSVLLPELARQGARPTVFVGTSAGAINATLYASLAHLPAEEAAAVALDRWRSVHAQMVFRPAWQTLPPLGVRYAAALAGSPERLTGLLDTGPLARTLTTLLDWEQLGRNLQAGAVDALAVVTTECETGRTKVFYQGAGQALTGVPDTDDERAMDYLREDLTAEHVRASAAIPIAFPPVRLHGVPGASWHMDGGVRLNAPLKPAIALGARRLVVVATDPPFHRPSSAAVGRPAPSIQDATGQLLHGAMADRMIEDLIVLAKLNKLLASGGAGARSRSGRPYQVIPFVFGGPDTLGTLGATAEEVLGEVLRGAGKLRHLDLALLSGLLGAGPASRGDLLSYLFFEPAFMDAAIRLGRHDGEALLDRPPLWKDAEFPPR
jgi:NTE family protein